MELRSKLPRGDVGRIINSFIFHQHPDAEAFQRLFRQALYAIKTILCPLVFGDIYYFHEGDAEFHRNFDEGNETGWGHIDLCDNGCCVTRLTLCHEENANRLNLQIHTCNYGFFPTENLLSREHQQPHYRIKTKLTW